MATTREIGQYRDAKLVAEDLLRKSGPVLESAVQDYLKHQVTGFYTQAGPDLRHRLTGRTIEEEIAALRKEKPHYYADWAPDTEDQIEHTTIEAACLTPSPKTVAALFKLVGEPRAKTILAQWGTDWVRMLPGNRPGYAEKQAANKGDDDSGSNARNPWHPRFVGDDAQREAEKTRLFRAIGTKRCVAMAAEAGVTVLGWPLKK